MQLQLLVDHALLLRLLPRGIPWNLSDGTTTAVEGSHSFNEILHENSWIVLDLVHVHDKFAMGTAQNRVRGGNSCTKNTGNHIGMHSLTPSTMALTATMDGEAVRYDSEPASTSPLSQSIVDYALEQHDTHHGQAKSKRVISRQVNNGCLECERLFRFDKDLYNLISNFSMTQLCRFPWLI